MKLRRQKHEVCAEEVDHGVEDLEDLAVEDLEGLAEADPDDPVVDVPDDPDVKVRMDLEVGVVGALLRASRMPHLQD